MAAITAMTMPADNKPYTLRVSMPQRFVANATTADMEVVMQNDKGEVTVGTLRLTANADNTLVGELQGTTDDAYAASAVWTEDPHVGYGLILEPGVINATAADHGFSITGTPLNDTYAEYMAAMDKAHENGSMGMTALTALTEEYMAKYCDTPIFALLFGSHYSVMMGKKDDVERLYAMASDKQKLVKTTLDAYRRVCKNDVTNGEPLRDVLIPNATIEGNDARLSDFIGKGKWVFVDFWASWCGGCRQAIPRVKKAYEQVKDKNIMFISIAEWDRRSAALKAMEKEDMPWLQLIDEKGACGTAYMFNTIPRLMLFAPDGTLADKDVNVQKLEEILIQKLKQ